ncbi:inovirus Gp2 family protein [Serratia marcescens]|uniref:Inovirus Gp2 family protein n=1 Tax=Serratia marcescens TaxID=615 RepID=A0A5C7CMH9_SERMA|nr:inovirus-type Gp2 protein [Serratia marcescens]TXE37246.1 inovirus Gp2 family protein [Serratia marcescens]TXE68309.1 inovirus Gp2 family protein [Serratia marcescens]
MNDHHTGTVAGNAVDAENIRAFLQQAVDHYPRLVAFSFTLVLPYGETLADYHALILRFHTEVWQRTGEYSQARQRERRSSPPTLLRWVWEAASAPECKMVLMLNLDTLGTERNPQLTDSALQALNGIIAEAWQTVAGTACIGVTSMAQNIISRAGRDAFTTPFNRLKTRVQEMTLPVMTARTGVIRL